MVDGGGSQRGAGGRTPGGGGEGRGGGEEAQRGEVHALLSPGPPEPWVSVVQLQQVDDFVQGCVQVRFHFVRQQIEVLGQHHLTDDVEGECGEQTVQGKGLPRLRGGRQLVHEARCVGDEQGDEGAQVVEAEPWFEGCALAPLGLAVQNQY